MRMWLICKPHGYFLLSEYMSAAMIYSTDDIFVILDQIIDQSIIHHTCLNIIQCEYIYTHEIHIKYHTVHIRYDNRYYLFRSVHFSEKAF
jgi:hypothetical protein